MVPLCITTDGSVDLEQHQGRHPAQSPKHRDDTHSVEKAQSSVLHQTRRVTMNYTCHNYCNRVHVAKQAFSLNPGNTHCGGSYSHAASRDSVKPEVTQHLPNSSGEENIPSQKTGALTSSGQVSNTLQSMNAPCWPKEKNKIVRAGNRKPATGGPRTRRRGVAQTPPSSGFPCPSPSSGPWPCRVKGPSGVPGRSTAAHGFPGKGSVTSVSKPAVPGAL